MPIKQGFLDKLIERLDKLDSKSLQTQFMRLVQERGLLETIFQSIQEGVVVLDGAGSVTYANRAVQKLLGVEVDDAGGRKLKAIMREMDVEQVLELGKTEWAGLVSREIEIFYPEHRFISFYAVPVAGSEIEGVGAVLILRDVTRDKEQEASNIESEKVNAVKLLAAGVAHEIGNPLNALNIHLQLLEREIRRLGDKSGSGSSGDSASDLEQMVGVCRTEVSRLDLIITQFLKAVRPAKPSMAPDKIDDVLKDVLNLMKHDVESRSINVAIRCPDQIPDINIDRDQIKQAFFNVIKNALQAMKDGGILEISIKIDSQYMHVAFADNGVGIDPEDLSHVFDAYYTTREKGSGLGLMIVQRIVQDHGGQIIIRSEPGEGTEFVILLPLVERRVHLLTHGERLD